MATIEKTAGFNFERTTIRRWVRADPPVWGFWWRGAVPAVALVGATIFAVTRFAHATVEKTVEAQARATLTAAGFGWVNVKADGQNVHLTGSSPAGADGNQAIALVEDTECDSWAGKLDCTRHVTGDFTRPAVAPVAVVPEARAWHDLQFTLGEGALTLAGEIPSLGKFGQSKFNQRKSVRVWSCAA
jgi:hypothetical protein